MREALNHVGRIGNVPQRFIEFLKGKHSLAMPLVRECHLSMTLPV
jgi:hypothetical protein